VVTVTGLMNSSIVESFGSQFGAWFQSHPGVKHLVVDLGDVSFMDSSGSRVLIGINKLVAERSGDMNLARPQPNLKMVLGITCTNRSLPVFGSVEEALHAAGGRPARRLFSADSWKR
jgi:anti-sigma B factor antagonist